MSGPLQPDPVALRRARLRLLLGLVLAAALLAALVGVAQLRERRRERASWPVAAGRAPLRGLEAPAAVARDRRGIAHVEAASEADAWRVLGYVHAQDRLAQMIWQARSARGRAAELAGEVAVAADREARVLGIGRHADAQLADLDPEARDVLAAYADGVNARLDEIRAGRSSAPLPLQTAGGALEPWTPADSLAVAKLYAWGLAGSLARGLVLEDMIQQLGGLAAAPFFPENAGIRTAPTGTEVRAPRPAPGPVPDALRVAGGFAGQGLGSSAWVVGGRHAQSGRPLLAADIHLEATVPALYHEVHLRGGALDVAGVTLPGVPVFWSGRNPALAWASTHARAAVADLYVETLDPAEPSRYHDGRRWQPLSVRQERIEVRGGEPVLLEVRETAHGPLVNDLVGGGRDPLALAWAGARAGPGVVAAFLRVARATSAAELREALSRHTEPVLAVVYAEAAGAAGLQTAGWIPRRTLPTGLVPVPGRAEWYDWSGPVPYEDLPRAALADGNGWLIAADNPLPGTGAGVEWLWRGGERAARIEALLRDAAAAGALDARSLAAMQGDLRSGRALELVRDALVLAGDPAALGSEAREVAELLRGWDGETGTESVQAAIYHVFLHELTRELFEARIGKELLAQYVALPDVSPSQLVGRMLTGALRGGLDAQGWDAPASVGEAVRASLRGVWLHLSVRAGQNRDKWRWGRLHPLVFRVLVPTAPGDALGPFAFPGDGTSVAAGGYDPSRPFDTRVASLYRLVVDTGERGHALSSLAPGPSEHPGHPHRESGLARWLEARPSLLFTSPLLVEEATAERLALEPVR